MEEIFIQFNTTYLDFLAVMYFENHENKQHSLRGYDSRATLSFTKLLSWASALVSRCTNILHGFFVVVELGEMHF